MGKIKVENLIGKGIMARVIDGGKLYSTYKDFAEVAGYPDAVVKVWTDAEFRKGEKAENLEGSVVIVLAKGNHGDYSDTIYVVEDDEGERYLFGEKGLEIIKTTEKKRVTYDEALVNANKALADLRAAAYAEGYAQGKFDAEIEKAHGKPKSYVKSPQQIRDEIVERAKADVNDDIYQLTKSSWGKAYVVRGLRTNPEFIVNKEKRAVTVLMRGVLGGKVHGKGIAKCAPNDCFNSHIGKAIALRRALGLDVPSEYYNAPQPTEVRVGDVVEWDKHTGNTYKIAEGLRVISIQYGDDVTAYANMEYANIIDDSRE